MDRMIFAQRLVKLAKRLVAEGSVSAVALRNAILNALGGERLSSFGSNPYSNRQMLRVSVGSVNGWKDKEDAVEVIDKLTAWCRKEGFDIKKKGRASVVLQRGDNVVDASVYDTDVSMTPVERIRFFVEASIVGPKNAKPTTIPYYD